MMEREILGQAVVDLAGAGTISTEQELTQAFGDFSVDYVAATYTPAEVFGSTIAGLAALAAWATANGWTHA